MELNFGGKVFAVDFDGTCVGNAYPRIGRNIGAEKVLRRIVDAGGRLILWTMRRGIPLEGAIRWFEFHEIPLYGVNRAPDQDAIAGDLLSGPSPKVAADVFIDDRALGTPLRFFSGERKLVVNWLEVERLIFGNVVAAPSAETDA